MKILIYHIKFEKWEEILIAKMIIFFISIHYFKI